MMWSSAGSDRCFDEPFATSRGSRLLTRVCRVQYSFSMIIYQLFEGMPPFAGQDPVEAAKKASLRDMRPTLNKLLRKEAPYPVRPLLLSWIIGMPSFFSIDVSDLSFDFAW